MTQKDGKMGLDTYSSFGVIISGSFETELLRLSRAGGGSSCERLWMPERPEDVFNLTNLKNAFIVQFFFGWTWHFENHIECALLIIAYLPVSKRNHLKSENQVCMFTTQIKMSDYKELGALWSF